MALCVEHGWSRDSVAVTSGGVRRPHSCSIQAQLVVRNRREAGGSPAAEAPVLRCFPDGGAHEFI
jgi:hypothetical protein